MKKNPIILIILLLIAGVILSGCIKNEEKKYGNASETGKSEIATQELKKFSSAQEIREFLKASAMQPNFGGYGTGFGIRGDMVMEKTGPIGAPPMPAPSPVQIPMATATPAVAGGAGTKDYSTTNIQVEGVDEADFVKNDGKYIYVLEENKLVIVDAYPAEKANIVSETRIEGRPSNIFVNGDRLAVFTEDDNQVLVYPEYDYRPVPRYTPNTSAIIYDISDRKKPERLKEYSINGNYFQSRMIGDHVYFIVKDNVYYYDNVIDLPAIRQGSVKIMAPDVYYFDNPEQNYVFHTIASFNIKSDKEINAKSFMMGYSDNLYVSGSNIYIAYRKNVPFGNYREQQEERFYRVVVPLLPKDAQDRINEIKGKNLSSYEKWEMISSVLENTYNSMDEKEKKDYAENVEKAAEEYDMKLAQESEKTVIHKIKIESGGIEYETRGEVPGTLLNQFSMDESGDHFRVATTSQLWTRRGSIQYNNVYILDKELSTVGKLEKIAPDERIYSARFMGDRLYMVTFRRIDPLFVIDLSTPKEPKVLGELKIPGFSDYLHPYDEKHIIGVGKETGDNEWGGVSIKGVKISLFDVSDVEKPKQIDAYEIGKAGTDSEALRDHKAFLFDKKKNLLVIPITEVEEGPRPQYSYPYRQKVWQGAYVFGISVDGFKLRGKISHLDDYEEGMYYLNSPSAVRRSLYMDDMLYTVSARKILINSLEDISLINSIELPFEFGKYYEYGWK